MLDDRRDRHRPLVRIEQHGPLARDRHHLAIEQESRPGYHSTGRSAAISAATSPSWGKRSRSIGST